MVPPGYPSGVSVTRAGDINHLMALLRRRTSALVLVDSELPSGVLGPLSVWAAEIGTIRVERVAVTPKSLEIASELVTRLFHSPTSTVIAVGGGSLCDMASFAASCANRRINLVLVPTTTVAMCDAAISRAAGIDVDGIKNMWSCSSATKEVVVCPALLQYLPQNHLVSGLSEVIKMVYMDHTTPSDLERLRKLGLSVQLGDFNALVATVKWGMEIQGRWQTSIRSSGLNLFGHNVGHALEVTTGLPHGESVAHGMLVELRMAAFEGLFVAETFTSLCSTFSSYGLPTTPAADLDIDPRDLEAAAIRQRLSDGTHLDLWIPQIHHSPRHLKVPSSRVKDALVAHTKTNYRDKESTQEE